MANQGKCLRAELLLDEKDETCYCKNQNIYFCR